MDLERGALITALAVELPRRPAGVYRVAQAVLSYDDSDHWAHQQLTADAVVEFVTDESRVPAGINPVGVEEGGGRPGVAPPGTHGDGNAHAGTLHWRRHRGAGARTQALLAAQGRIDQAQEVTQAIAAIRQGDTSTEAEKTLMGTILDLEQGKRKA